MPPFLSSLQMFLCGVNALVVYLVCLITTALRETDAIDPVEMLLEMSMRTSVRPVVGVQDAHVSRLLSKLYVNSSRMCVCVGGCSVPSRPLVHTLPLHLNI